MSTETSDKSVNKNEILSNDSITSLKSESTLDIDPNETFVCTYSQIQELFIFHETFRNLKIMNYEKCGHVARMTLLSQDLYQIYLFWSSSPNLHGDYYINYKMFHSYMCSGILNIQYERFSDFSGIGIPSKRFRTKTAGIYGESVKYFRDLSISDAKRQEQYKFTKVLSYQYVTKRQEGSSQKHEFHDRNSSISSFIEKDKPGVIDCLDTWHAGKEVRKAIGKVAKGPKKNHGITWHTELADKTAGVKTHTYWAMKNYKRIHYGEQTYEIRTGLGILDWNEHVDRPVSSEKVFRRVTQTRNRTPERVLKPKTYSFVLTLWDIYCNFLSGEIGRDIICDRGQDGCLEDDILQDSDESDNEESDTEN
ncbi:unnamed protein product [Mytilus edulis]|uniref:Uncharacterized protein n=1 Tax=Mytilus edulis TaxID=6550 RepID=A0A8S3U151_MYTED|nr:unnamed protein product [Mytilus edulis]